MAGGLIEGPPALPALACTALQLTCRARQEMSLSNPWSDLHGGFGLMLKTHWPPVFEEMLGGLQREGGVRPYVLSHDLYEGWLPLGETFLVQLVLFGAGSRFWAACCDALARLGENGVTPERLQFDVERIEARTDVAASEFRNLWIHGEWHADAAPCFSLTDSPHAMFAVAGLLRIEYRSPLQLQLENRMADEPPSLAAVVDRGLARLQHLSDYAGRQSPVTREQRRQVQAALQSAECVQDDAGLVWSQRFSRRQGHRIPLPGIVGQQIWRLDAGMAAAVRAWAPVLQLVHVGKKTSMGFGEIRIDFQAARAR